MTVAEQPEMPVVRIDAGSQTTATEVTLMGIAMVTVAVPVLVASWTEVAVMVAIPGPEGTNTPAVVIVPSLAVHVTAGL